MRGGDQKGDSGGVAIATGDGRWWCVGFSVVPVQGLGLRALPGKATRPTSAVAACASPIVGGGRGASSWHTPQADHGRAPNPPKIRKARFLVCYRRR